MPKDILYIDFETRSDVDLKKSGADVYARSPNTKVMAFGYAFNDDEVVVNEMDQNIPFDVFTHVGSGGTVVAHNAHFEWVIWNYAWKKQFPKIPALNIEQLDCTMAMAYAMALPGSLENAAAATGIDFQKDMKGQRVTLQLAKPKTEDPLTFIEPDIASEKFKIMYEYCKTDIEVERALYKRLTKLSPREKSLWILDHKINQRGVGIDTVAVNSATLLVESEKQRLDKKMREITEGNVATCTSAKQLTDWLILKGVQVEGVAKNDVLDALQLEHLPSECREALLLRQEAAKSSNAKLTAMIKASDNSRVRGSFQYHGASTGRWASRRLQLQNLPRPKISQSDIESVISILRGIGG